MRLSKALKNDQEIITRFITALGSGSVALSNSKLPRPDFFIIAHTFVKEFIEEGFFKKEEVLIKVLDEGGFPPDSGPIAAIRTDQKKASNAAQSMLNAAKQWEAGDHVARSETGWATGEVTATVRQHLERLKSLILPLIEQTISVDEEHNVSEEINSLVFEGALKNGTEKYIKLIEQLEEKLSDWK
jgi:hemerythrin-like domain-containing protein